MFETIILSTGLFEDMIWQDVVFLLGGFIGAGILLPSLYDSETTVPITTSMFQVGLISVFAYTFWTLSMPLSALGASLRVLVWFGIALIRNDKNVPQSFTTKQTET